MYTYARTIYTFRAIYTPSIAVSLHLHTIYTGVINGMHSTSYIAVYLHLYTIYTRLQLEIHHFRGLFTILSNSVTLTGIVKNP